MNWTALENGLFMAEVHGLTCYVEDTGKWVILDYQGDFGAKTVVDTDNAGDVQEAMETVERRVRALTLN